MSHLSDAPNRLNRATGRLQEIIVLTTYIIISVFLSAWAYYYEPMPFAKLGAVAFLFSPGKWVAAILLLSDIVGPFTWVENLRQRLFSLAKSLSEMTLPLLRILL